MKKIGMIGGEGWRSTVEYYEGICLAWERIREERNEPGPASPEMCIESLDLDKGVSLFGSDAEAGSWTAFDDYHRQALERLVRSGAQVAFIASNTPHERFDSITAGIGIPVVDIFAALARKAMQMGARTVLILGTAVTMTSCRLREIFQKREVAAVAPPAALAGRTLALIEDLQLGKPTNSRERLVELIDACRSSGLTFDAVCLACTELPLALGDLTGPPVVSIGEVPYIDSVKVHIDAVIDSVQ